MDTARDLACADLWQASLERSLARRGRSSRSSFELSHLRPERDLSCIDIVRESAAFSQMRRSAAARRPAMSLPGAGGISALALLAATTLPGLLGGRGGSARAARITYRADAQAPRQPAATVDRAAAASATASATAKAETLLGTSTVAAASAAATATPAHAVSAHTSAPAAHASRPATIAHTPHIAAAHDASVSAGGAPVSQSVSGGAAPAAVHSVSAAATVRHASGGVHTVTAVHRVSAVHRLPTIHRAPAVHRITAGAPHTPTVHRITTGGPHAPATATHAGTGGGAIEEATTVGHPRTTTTPSKPQSPADPKPVTQTHPVAKTHPVATTPPAPKPAPAPTVAPGHYVNPLAGASVTPERVDQGVDYSGSGTLGAIGAGKVTYVGTSGTGWPGAFVEYQLSDGPDAGRYVYYAEGVNPAAGLHVGETLSPGQPVAHIISGSSSGIEIGWGSGVGTQPLAQALGQWSGSDDSNSVASPAGKDFSSLIAQLGGPPGKVEG